MQDRLGVEIALVGVTSSRKMLLEPKGLSLDSWQEQFSSATFAADMDAFTDAVSQVDSDAVIFDCTASPVPGKFYPKWMDKGVHVITPNKKLHSGPLDKYLAVRNMQANGKAHYFYEVSLFLDLLYDVPFCTKAAGEISFSSLVHPGSTTVAVKAKDSPHPSPRRLHAACLHPRRFWNSYT